MKFELECEDVQFKCQLKACTSVSLSYGNWKEGGEGKSRRHFRKRGLILLKNYKLLVQSFDFEIFQLNVILRTLKASRCS